MARATAASGLLDRAEVVEQPVEGREEDRPRRKEGAVLHHAGQAETAHEGGRREQQGLRHTLGA